MVVVAATWLEASAARRVLRGTGIEVVRVGVGGAPVRMAEGKGPVVVVGLCGALVPLRPGTVVVPDEVGEPDGALLQCDGELVVRLRSAASARGWPLARGRQLTAPRILRGPERAHWAHQGFETVDMEAGVTLKQSRGAVVRVVLDTPGDELPAARDLLRPGHWPAAARVALRAPGYAHRSALLVADLVATRTLKG